MTAPKKAIYPLIFSILALSGSVFGVEALYKQTIAKLSAELKKGGQKRIAQGIQSVVAKDPDTGEVFNAKAPLMLTTNKETGAWTISVLHDKIVGSTLLIGNELRRPQKGEIPHLKSFNRKVAEAVIPTLKSYDPAFYPDEIARLIRKYSYRRVFTGKIKLTTHDKLKTLSKLVFADILVEPKHKDFIVLIVDKNGICFKITFGGHFAEKS